MIYVVYMQNKKTLENIMMGVFLMRMDAETFFDSVFFESKEHGYHIAEVNGWTEWSKIKEKLPSGVAI